MGLTEAEVCGRVVVGCERSTCHGVNWVRPLTSKLLNLRGKNNPGDSLEQRCLLCGTRAFRKVIRMKAGEKKHDLIQNISWNMAVYSFRKSTQQFFIFNLSKFGGVRKLFMPFLEKKVTIKNHNTTF